MPRIEASLAFEISAQGSPDAVRERADEAGRLSVRTTAAVKALANEVLGSRRIESLIGFAWELHKTSAGERGRVRQPADC
jgi:hypothetical protein